MSHIAYYKVSEMDFPIHEQRQIISSVHSIDKAFSDHDVSVRTPIAKRLGFSSMLASLRSGDTIYVLGLDRFGKDAVDIFNVIEKILSIDVTIYLCGLGEISNKSGQYILHTLRAMAAIEKRSIFERTTRGRELAKRKLASSGTTHRGKVSLGRPRGVNYSEVQKWRKENKASISETSEHFQVSAATVKRCMRHAS